MTFGSNNRAGDRFWVLGGRWTADARHLPRPRVFGPYRDYLAALDSAEGLNALGGANELYLVVGDVPARGDSGPGSSKP